jgi:hypothetical protein
MMDGFLRRLAARARSAMPLLGGGLAIVLVDVAKRWT